jgi:hypothetical protein
MRLSTLACLPLLAGALGACDTLEKLNPFAGTPKAELVVADQPVRARAVRIAKVEIEEDGFVVIHETAADGKPVAPGSIGSAPVKKGVNENVAVRLNKPVKRGATLIAMLHRDTGKKGVYEFGPASTEEDKPLVIGGNPVTKPFVVK